MSDLEQAPFHVKLAVDLIMLLEQNGVSPQQALDALAIVSEDCQRKLDEQDT
jgi:hypothetical protein